MEQRIVQVIPSENYFSITWKLSIRCNYDCMYCPTKWHDTTSPQHSLETLQNAWTSVYKKTNHIGLPYKISFTGGEVTSNKNFLPFVEWLRSNYNDKIFMLLTTTNGSATFKYYLNLFKSIDNISFSVHSEHIDEKKFFSMIVDLKNSINSTQFLHVNIMDEFWNQDRIKLYEKILVDNDISYNINNIDYELKTRDVPNFKGYLNLEI
jgi:MoaA/NifB/PqqE/SkfB family radical SAM enzyme